MKHTNETVCGEFDNDVGSNAQITAGESTIFAIGL